MQPRVNMEWHKCALGAWLRSFLLTGADDRATFRARATCTVWSEVRVGLGPGVGARVGLGPRLDHPGAGVEPYPRPGVGAEAGAGLGPGELRGLSPDFL